MVIIELIGYLIILIGMFCFFLSAFYNIKRMKFESIIGAKGLTTRSYYGMYPKKVIVEIIRKNHNEFIRKELEKALEFRKMYFRCLLFWFISLFIASIFFRFSG